ncbi:MAG: hypothetical protein M3Q33_11320 [Acidobacteriota bacterium]|nr:hypothetical protein [Acidobacteriota bacterium]
MKFQNSHKFIALFFVALLGISCQKQTTEGGKASTPTEAYQMLYTAVKAKDTEKIKQVMSKNSLALAEAQAQRQKQTLEKTLENGFLATTFSDTMPQIRDERVKDEFGAVEVYNQKDGRWDDTFFINEDGGWKLAVGDMFKGSFKQPGKSKAQLEKEISNSSGNNMIPSAPNINTNFSPNKNSNVKTVEVTPENKPKK